jgi:hypothetical protein
LGKARIGPVFKNLLLNQPSISSIFLPRNPERLSTMSTSMQNPARPNASDGSALYLLVKSQAIICSPRAGTCGQIGAAVDLAAASHRLKLRVIKCRTLPPA